jgi:hypothetical protein
MSEHVLTVRRAASPTPSELYVLLGVWPPRTVDVGVAAAILDCRPEVAEQQLLLFQDAGQLISIGPGSWTRPDEVYGDQCRRACERIATGEFTAVARRLGDYVLAHIDAAHQLIAPTRPRLHRYHPAYTPPITPVFADEAAARAWLTGQIPTILAVAHRAHTVELHQLGWALLDGPWPLIKRVVDSRHLDIVCRRRGSLARCSACWTRSSGSASGRTRARPPADAPCAATAP